MCRVSCQELVLPLGILSRMCSQESKVSPQKLLELLLIMVMNHSRIILCTQVLLMVQLVLCSLTRFWKASHLAYSRRTAVQCNTT